MRLPRICLGLLVLALGTGMSAGETGYRVVEVKNGGKVVGTVRFSEDYPPAETVKITSDNEVCGLSKPLEDFVVDPQSKGLANAVVTIEGVAEGKGFAEGREILLSQEGCRYFPHVQVFRSRDKLVVLNKDNLLHNVHVHIGDKTLFNVAQPAIRKRLARPLESAEVVRVTCDVHQWMSAYLVPVEHPYYAITGEKGEFEIDQVPPGTYKVLAWHEVLGTMEKKVTISAGATAAVKFEILSAE